MADHVAAGAESEDGLPAKRPRPDVPCAVCARAAARYRCPRCATRTCSAACVAAHKAARGCNGKRDAARYASIPQFDDALLLRDYRFLEEAGRSVEAARREAERHAAQRGRRGGRGGGRRPVPPQPGPGGALQLPQEPASAPLSAARAALLRGATARGVHLRLMAAGMSRAAANTLRHVAERRPGGDGTRGGGARGGGRGGRGAGAGRAEERGDKPHDRLASAPGAEPPARAPPPPPSLPPPPAEAAEAAPGADDPSRAALRGNGLGLLEWRVEIEVSGLGLTLTAERAPESLGVLALIRATVEASAGGATERGRRMPAEQGGDAGGAAAQLPTMSGVVQRHRLSRYVSGLVAEEERAAAAEAARGAEAGGNGAAPERREGAGAPAPVAPGLLLLMRDEGARADARSYLRLPLRATLGEALRGCVVFEFPTVHLLTAEEGAEVRADGAPRWPTVPHPGALEA